MALETIKPFELKDSFEQLEELAPGIKSKPGYFRYNPKSALKLADWVERYQSLIKEHVSKYGTYTFSNFDTETTGLNPPEDFGQFKAGITDIAVSRMPEGKYLGNEIDEDGNQSTLDNEYEFESLSNPGVTIPEEVVNLTGITNEMAQMSKPQKEVVVEFKKYTDNTIFVGHNIGDNLHNERGYDIYNVIGPIYKTYFGVEVEDLLARAIDTLPLFRFLVDGTSHTNDDFCQMMGVTLKGAHRAMPDVRANALAFSKLKPFLDHLDVEQLREHTEKQLEVHSFHINSITSEGKLKKTWCEIEIRLNDDFKVVNSKTQRTVVSYARVQLTSNGLKYTDTLLRDNSVVSADVIRESHPENLILRKALVRDRLDTVDELIERYCHIVW